MQESMRRRLENITDLYIDIDHVINHYDELFARQFSVETAKSFVELHPYLTARFDIDELIELAICSYQKTGRTTALFAEKFGIDEMELYQHHHDTLCEPGAFIEQQFQNGNITIDPELRDLLIEVKSLGVSLRAFTNGTKKYAEIVLSKPMHDLIDLMDAAHGMDSVPNIYMFDKRHGSFWNDILIKDGLAKQFKANKGMGIEDFDHSHVAVIDDTHRNHRAPKYIFNMTTILQRNNDNYQGPSWTHDIVSDFKDALRAIVKAKTTYQSTSHLRLVNG